MLSDLERIVLDSRFISCAMKSSLLPTPTLPGRIDVALKPHQLLVHAYLVSVDGHFLEDPAVIDDAVSDQLLYFFVQALLVSSYDLRRALRDKIHMALHLVQLAHQIVPEEFSLPGPGLQEVLRRLAHNRAQALPQLYGIHGLLFHREDVRIFGQGGDSDVVVEPVFLCHLPEIPEVLSGDLSVVFDLHVRFLQILVSDVNIHFAASDIFLEFSADTRFQHAQLPGHLDPDIKVAVIY